MRAIVDAKQRLLVHATMGADVVLEELTDAAHLKLPPDALVHFEGSDQHELLARAADAHAYTIVGRIPFASGKLPRAGLEPMVQGDPRLRRPYLVETAARAPDEARALAAWLRSNEVQAWLAEYGKGRYDAQSLFFPIARPR